MVTRVGRRPGNADTRTVILDAARQAFAQDGFAATSLRKIAATAGVDAALIHHYFGTKRKLFLTTLRIEVDIPAKVAQIAAGEPATIGERLIAEVVRTWDSPAGPALVAAFRAALTDPQSSAMIREFIGVEIFSRLLRQFHYPPPQAQLRGGLLASQIIGLIMGRYLIGLPQLTAMRADQIAALVGPTMQRYLTGELDVESCLGSQIGIAGTVERT